MALTAAVALIASLLAAGSAQATTVSKPGFTSSVTAKVSPTRLPAKGAAPVTLTLTGRSTRTVLGTPPRLMAVKVRTDRRVTVDTEGLPSCPREKVHGTNSLSEARKQCRSALIGSGKATSILHLPEREPAVLRYSMLLFNTVENGKPEILLYTIAHGGIEEIGLAGVIGDIREFEVSIGEYEWDVTNSFQYKIGATWKHRGKRHSYLNGTCAKGIIKNKVTMTMSNGVAKGAKPQRCTATN